MIRCIIRQKLLFLSSVRPAAVALCAAVSLALVISVSAHQQDQTQQAPLQSTGPTQAPAATLPATENQTPQPVPAQAPAATPAPAKTAKPATPPQAEITEAEIRQMLVGKDLYLRDGYLSDSLNFNEHGVLIGHSLKGSYTLSAVKIDRVKLTKHKLELEGSRYALHFLGAMPYEDISTSLDRVRITPPKKALRITIDRELVVTEKNGKESGKWLFGKSSKPAPAAKPPAKPAQPAAAATPAQPAPAATPAQPETAATPTQPATATAPVQTEAPTAPGSTPAQPEIAASPAATAPPAATAAPTPPETAATPTTPTQPAPSATPAQPAAEPSEAEQIKAEIATAPAAERPVDPASITRTFSPAHANKLLKDALNKIFAQGMDDAFMASLPGFWKLYYQAAAAKTDYRPTDPAVQRQNTVDKKATLLTFTDPQSNDYAQANAVAGMALYHTVVGPDGKAAEIAVGRPIGFGLDENAVDAIRKATFEPAILAGKPVPVMLNMVVQFRIYSKRTGAVAKAAPKDQPTEQPSLPGPYSKQDQQ